MLDPRLLYTFNPTLWESMRGSRPVLLHFLDGYIDAGQVGRIVSEHVLNTCEHELLVEFDHDQLHDYRSRRPLMVFDTNRWRSVEPFSLKIHRVIAPQGEPFLLMAGPEPDVQWDRMVAAMGGLIERLDVRLALTAYGIPMGVPHTRPTLITAHATDEELITEGNPVWVGRVEIPGSFAAFLEMHLGRQHRKAMGLAVNVPHYLAQSPFHQAAVAAVERINSLTGLGLSVTGLLTKSITNLEEIRSEMADSAEAQGVVAGLEEQYDQSQAGSGNVPSADEIGAELERFLAEQNRKDDEGH